MIRCHCGAVTKVTEPCKCSKDEHCGYCGIKKRIGKRCIHCEYDVAHPGKLQKTLYGGHKFESCGSMTYVFRHDTSVRLETVVIDDKNYLVDRRYPVKKVSSQTHFIQFVGRVSETCYTCYKCHSPIKSDATCECKTKTKCEDCQTYKFSELSECRTCAFRWAHPTSWKEHKPVMDPILAMPNVVHGRSSLLLPGEFYQFCGGVGNVGHCDKCLNHMKSDGKCGCPVNKKAKCGMCANRLTIHGVCNVCPLIAKNPAFWKVYRPNNGVDLSSGQLKEQIPKEFKGCCEGKEAFILNAPTNLYWCPRCRSTNNERGNCKCPLTKVCPQCNNHQREMGCDVCWLLESNGFTKRTINGFFGCNREFQRVCYDDLFGLWKCTSTETNSASTVRVGMWQAEDIENPRAARQDALWARMRLLMARVPNDVYTGTNILIKILLWFFSLFSRPEIRLAMYVACFVEQPWVRMFWAFVYTPLILFTLFTMPSSYIPFVLVKAYMIEVVFKEIFLDFSIVGWMTLMMFIISSRLTTRKQWKMVRRLSLWFLICCLAISYLTIMQSTFVVLLGLAAYCQMTERFRIGFDPQQKQQFLDDPLATRKDEHSRFFQEMYIGREVSLAAQNMNFFVKNKGANTLGFAWRTISDGLCGLHSIYCHLPTFNYVALMHISMDKGEQAMEDLRTYFLRPEVSRFLKSEHFTRIVPVDQEFLREFAEKGTRPKDLDSQTIDHYAAFLGLPAPAIFTKGTAYEYVKNNGKDSVRNFPLKAILHTPGHFSYMTKGVMTMKDCDVSAGWVKFLETRKDNTGVHGFDEEKLNVMFLTRKQLLQQEDTLAGKLSRARDANNQLQTDLKNSNGQKTEMQNAFNGLHTAIKNDAVKYTGKTRIYKKKDDIDFSFEYSHDFIVGPEFTNVLKSRFIELFAKPHYYAHAGLRIVADFFNIKMLCDAANQELPMLEHAAKPHKTMKWFNEEDHVPYDFTRPIIIENIDRPYRKNHKKYCDPTKRVFLDETVKTYFEKKSALVEHFHILQDVVYYTDTLTAFKIGSKGAFTVGNYSLKVGRHYFFDNEGFYDVNENGTIHNHPNDNGYGYVSNLTHTGNRHFSMMLTEGFVNCTLIDFIMTGIDTSYCYYHFDVTKDPVYPLHDMYKSEVINQSIEITQEVVLSTTRSADTGLLNIGYLETGSRAISPNWRFYHWMDKEIVPKFENYTSNVDQFVFKLSQFKKDMVTAQETHFVEDEIYVETFLLLMQDKARNARLLAAGLKTPFLDDVSRLRFVCVVRIKIILDVLEALKNFLDANFAEYENNEYYVLLVIYLDIFRHELFKFTKDVTIAEICYSLLWSSLQLVIMMLCCVFHIEFDKKNALSNIRTFRDDLISRRRANYDYLNPRPLTENNDNIYRNLDREGAKIVNDTKKVTKLVVEKTHQFTTNVVNEVKSTTDRLCHQAEIQRVKTKLYYWRKKHEITKFGNDNLDKAKKVVDNALSEMKYQKIVLDNNVRSLKTRFLWTLRDFKNNVLNKLEKIKSSLTKRPEEVPIQEEITEEKIPVRDEPVSNHRAPSVFRAFFVVMTIATLTQPMSCRVGGDDYDDLEFIKETHFKQECSKKFFHAAGNASVMITDKGREAICTCKPHSYQKILQMDTPHHFGSCEKNLEACFKARAFNSAVEPDLNTCAEFRKFVHQVWFPRNEKKMENYIFNILTAEDLSMETFINDTAREKRTKYRNGLINVTDPARRIDWRYQFFVKPNELHFDLLKNVRPRLIANPSTEVKALGAYLARIMIKVMKHVEPGFISGYSLDTLSDKMAECLNQGKFSDENVYSYDGSSHDAHQNWPVMDTVDVFLLKFLLPRILARSECVVPKFRLQEILNNATNLKKRFYTNTGMKGWVYATVFSGDPFSTTLFNTTRSILYNRFAAWRIHPIVELLSSFWAAGDDILCWLVIKPIERNIKATLGSEGGVWGLGQCAKDFLVGKLAQHTFLSKQFICQGPVVAFMPVTNRLYKSGTSYSLRSMITKAQHRMAQILSQDFLPNCLYQMRERFREGICEQGKKFKKYMESLRFDYSYQMKINSRPFPPELDAEAFDKTDKSILFKISRDARDIRVRVGRMVDDLPIKSCQIIMNQPDKQKKRTNANKKKANKKNRSKNQVIEYVKKEQNKPKKLKVQVPGVDRSSFINKWLVSERNYALGLLNPTGMLCNRIPSAIPIPTCAATWAGRLSVALNATGFGFVMLNPFSTNCIQINTNAALTDTYSLINNATTIIPNSIVNSNSIIRLRVVSAMLKAVDLSPQLTKTGVIIAGMTSFAQLTVNSTVADTLKDSYYSAVIPSQSAGTGVGGVYLPVDPSALNFAQPTLQPTDFFAPFIYFSACAANAQISIDYHINYEYVPAPGQTDLLKTSLGDIGDPDNGIRMTSDLVRSVKARGGLGKIPLGFSNYSKTGSIRA